MWFTYHINSWYISCHFHIRDIRLIRHLLPLSAAISLSNMLVSSNPNVCYLLYPGVSEANLKKYSTYQSLWILSLLLHQIFNTSRQYLTITLAINHTAHQLQTVNPYIQNTSNSATYISIQWFCFPSHSRSTRSTDSSVLSIPYVRTSLGKRAFFVITSRLWNSLPPDTRNFLSFSKFHSKHIFLS